MAAALRTVAGDRVDHQCDRLAARVDTTVELPIGTTWRVGYDPVGAAEFEVGPKSLLIVARYACFEGKGLTVTDVAVAEVVMSAPAPSPGPTSVVP